MIFLSYNLKLLLFRSTRGRHIFNRQQGRKKKRYLLRNFFSVINYYLHRYNNNKYSCKFWADFGIKDGVFSHHINFLEYQTVMFVNSILQLTPIGKMAERRYWPPFLIILSRHPDVGGKLHLTLARVI